MRYLDFYNKLDSMKHKEYIENFLVYNTSLVIAGAKPAVTITIKKSNKRVYKSWKLFGKDFVNSIQLKFVELRRSNESVILMIYDENILKKKFINKDYKEFLNKLGYPSEVEVEEYVKTLKSRYDKYHCPHELGLFLGIPFEDVKDFMECTTKKCLLCGYWKVYNNTVKAKRTFSKYDKVKEFTMKNMLEGNLSQDLVFNIKNSFKL